ncbi:MAG: pyridoxal phosphate-dependent aminotransferase [Alphaproteobacteria bacterium]
MSDGTAAMLAFEQRNRHFDRLVSTDGLMWLGQNTNHFAPPPAVSEAMHAVIDEERYHVYAPPVGLEELRALIVADLGLPGQAAMVTDGAVIALYHTCHTFLRPGDSLVTTDPSWAWPMKFARAIGAEVRQIPIYGPEHGYRLEPGRLEEAIDATTRVIYFVDPNNPLSTVATRGEIEQIVAIAERHDCILIQDCTYRDFAYEHHLAARLAPERVITITSFSKWLGLAGLRVGALVAAPALVQKLADAPPNVLGSSMLAQRAAIAGLKHKAAWFPDVLRRQRRNQDRIREAASRVAGLHLPVDRQNGNFLVIECGEAGVRPEALCQAMAARNIMIRQGSYHTPTFGDRFVKVSTTVPEAWADAFCDCLAEAVEHARGMNTDSALF